MIVYRKPTPLTILPCGHAAPVGAECAHRSHWTASGARVLRKGESVTLTATGGQR